MKHLILLLLFSSRGFSINSSYRSLHAQSASSLNAKPAPCLHGYSAPRLHDQTAPSLQAQSKCLKALTAKINEM